ncbi:hypothetical protein AA18895_0941 [Acetobacter ghanensis DSM 18895]|nr:hypothetical protein [Acetobacter ghanensis]GBQ47029.1 hypothetical protein AA18895_0941 [Acetobacter ghanensis DSM 18895]
MLVRLWKRTCDRPKMFLILHVRRWLDGSLCRRRWGSRVVMLLRTGGRKPPLYTAGRAFERVPFSQKSFGNLICRTAGRTDNLHEHSLSRASPGCPGLVGTAGKASWQKTNVTPLP